MKLRRTSAFPRAAMAAAALLAPACSEDGATPSETVTQELTQSEAGAIAALIAGQPVLAGAGTVAADFTRNPVFS